jgi:hypothetical protein
MAPEEAQQNAPRRRGRPPGSKTKTTRRKREGGGDLVDRLNAMVAELISKNRQLQRQVTKLTQKQERREGPARDLSAGAARARRNHQAEAQGGRSRERTKTQDGHPTAENSLLAPYWPSRFMFLAVRYASTMLKT